MLHKQPRNRPALKQVLQLDIVSRAAPKPAAPAERALPPSWRKVPSASRPGEFSYQQSQPQQSLAAAAVACSRRHLARARIARVRSPNRCGLSALRLILRRCNARDTADGTRSNTVENRVSRGRV